MQPQFITIEGGEGVGKTTNLRLIESLLQASGIDYVLTREPGGTPLAEEIRELLLKKRDENVDPVAELLLVFASRKQHVETTIKPALTQGKWVICDRFTDATFAYQGGGRSIDWQLIEAIESLSLGHFKPDKTLLLDLDPEIGMKRAAARGDFDRFESEQKTFFKQVREAYLKRVENEPERFILIDASHSLEQVQDDIKSRLNEFIQQVRNV